MNWNFRKYLYLLLVSQFAVFILMLAITFYRMDSFSDQSMGILQKESYKATEMELRARVDLVISHIESEMRQSIEEVSKIAKITRNNIESVYEKGGIPAVNSYINGWIPNVHATSYGHALEIILCDYTTGKIIRYTGSSNQQDLSEFFSLETFSTSVKTASVHEEIKLGSNTFHICSNQEIINMIVKNYMYDVIHSATYGGNAYTWVNEILNYDGGVNYAVRVIHPNLTDTEGIFLSTSQEDVAGNLPYLKELVGIREDGEVLHRYFFESKDGSGISEKLSYAKLYKPFDWIIATGEEIDEVDMQANQLTEINADLLTNMLKDTMLLLMLVFIVGSLIIFIIHHIGQNRLDAYIASEISLDELTGLYNRKYFYKIAQKLINDCDGCAYILRVNVRNFKVINDLYGIEKGDQLLRQIGHDLDKDGKKFNFVASRFSADNFYICVPQVNFDYLPLVRHVNVSWLEMDISLLYGVYAVESNSSVSVSQMCDRANMAITAGDKETGNYVFYYKDEFRQKLLEEKEIEREMEDALKSGQFVIYIQPKYDVTNGNVVGGEALVRWEHPTKGLIPPGDFIPLFERNGFIRNLDYYVWESCCAYMRCAIDRGIPVPPISVNVSRIHFYGKELQSKLKSLLDDYQLEPYVLELEVTETICAEDTAVFLETCGTLRKKGFKIAMDDFGSGYSSLNMLKELPLDVIKMDMRFLAGDQDPEQREKGRDILYSLMEMAQRLNLDIVVEGVETEDQVEFIKNIGKCSVQGFFYAHPLPAMDFETVLSL